MLYTTPYTYIIRMLHSFVVLFPFLYLRNWRRSLRQLPARATGCSRVRRSNDSLLRICSTWRAIRKSRETLEGSVRAIFAVIVLVYRIFSPVANLRIKLVFILRRHRAALFSTLQFDPLRIELGLLGSRSAEHPRKPSINEGSKCCEAGTYES